MPPANRHEPPPAKSSASDYSVTEFLAEFPDDAACLEHLWRTRYAPDGEHAHCPRCDCRARLQALRDHSRRQSWTCTGCGHHVHPTAGTIFHRSSTSLRLWFHAMYLMTSTRCGISAKQLERELGVHYKTAWRMFNKIRNELMAEKGGEAAHRQGRGRRDLLGRKAAQQAERHERGRPVPGGEDHGPRHGRARRSSPAARDLCPTRRAVKWSRTGQREPGSDPLYRRLAPLQAARSRVRGP